MFLMNFQPVLTFFHVFSVQRRVWPPVGRSVCASVHNHFFHQWVSSPYKSIDNASRPSILSTPTTHHHLFLQLLLLLFFLHLHLLLLRLLLFLLPPTINLLPGRIVVPNGTCFSPNLNILYCVSSEWHDRGTIFGSVCPRIKELKSTRRVFWGEKSSSYFKRVNASSLKTVSAFLE